MSSHACHETLEPKVVGITATFQEVADLYHLLKLQQLVVSYDLAGSVLQAINPKP